MVCISRFFLSVREATRRFYCVFLSFCEMPWPRVAHSELLVSAGVKSLGQNFTLRYPRAKKLCKACGYQFTRMTPRGKPLVTKVNAVLWYLSGISMNRIAFLARVSVQSVLNWIRAFAKDHYEKPEPTGKIIALELG